MHKAAFIILLFPLLVPAKAEKPAAPEVTSPLQENVIAIQNRALVKSNKWIFHSYFSMDFSDIPFTMYAVNYNIGKALNEYWEIYLNYVPNYLSNERDAAKKIETFTLPNGAQASVDIQKPKSFIGAEINWIPIYGKDSWGTFRIVRSDTFVNFGIGAITYDTNPGMRFKLALGKTFFISKYFNLRMVAGGAFQEILTSTTREYYLSGLMEAGLAFYF